MPKDSLHQKHMLMLGLASAALIAVLKLGSEVSEGETASFDRSLLEVLASWRTPTSIQAARDITALGSFSVLALVAFGVCTSFALTGRKLRAVLFVISIALAQSVSWALKSMYARARPGADLQTIAAQGASYPSGHSLMSAAFYLTLGSLVASGAKNAALERFAIAASIVLTLLVGVSRCFLGVHFPTDVLAGWIFGSLWALGTSALLKRTHRPV